MVPVLALLGVVEFLKGVTSNSGYLAHSRCAFEVDSRELLSVGSLLLLFI